MTIVFNKNSGAAKAKSVKLVHKQSFLRLNNILAIDRTKDSQISSFNAYHMGGQMVYNEGEIHQKSPPVIKKCKKYIFKCSVLLNHYNLLEQNNKDQKDVTQEIRY